MHFQERERQTFCLANWHDRVRDTRAPGRKVSGVWGSKSSVQVIRGRSQKQLFLLRDNVIFCIEKNNGNCANLEEGC